MTEDFKPRKLVTVKEAAILLGLSERWLWLRIREGAIPAIKLRGATRLSLVDLEAFVEKGRSIRGADDDKPRRSETS